MPRRAPRSCPRCGGTYPAGARCPSCRAAEDRAIKSRPEVRARRKVYASRRWAGVRRTVLAASPFCAEPGCSSLATDVDHRIPLGQWQGDPFDLANLQALCHRHHAAKTPARSSATRGKRHQMQRGAVSRTGGLEGPEPNGRSGASPTGTSGTLA
jgi:5-methylcytosine-specific restriction endonuclease McrA